MATDYSRHVFRELERATEEIENLKTNVIPELKRGYEAKLYDERATAAEKNSKLRKEKDAEISELKSKISELEKRLNAAENEVVRLKNMMNKDSTNSSKPPASDEPWKGKEKQKAANEYNSRKPSERHKGGQEGHKGKCLTKQDVEKLLKEHGDKIRHDVVEIGKNGADSGNEPKIKYELDLEMRMVVREYRYYGDAPVPPRHYPDVSFGDFTRAASAFCYGECNMPTDKIGELMSVLSGGLLNASNGSWYNFCTYVSDRCDASLDSLYNDLMNSPVLYSDATYTKENGEETYVRNVSNKNTVIYSPQDDKTIDGIGKTPVLSDFFGILMTDHETAMKHFGSDNAECNQHTDRYCTKTAQETSHCWSDKFMTLLYEIKDQKELLIGQGVECFSEKELAAYFKRYDDILQEGWEENKDLTWESVASDERALLRRLDKYKADHLRFATDFCVEFTNNISESDLRFIKNRTKLSGGFRQKSGRKMCCRLMSIIRTCKKRGLNVIEALMKISRSGENAFA